MRNDYGSTRDKLSAIHELADRLVGKAISITDMSVVTRDLTPRRQDGALVREMDPVAKAELRAMLKRAVRGELAAGHEPEPGTPISVEAVEVAPTASEAAPPAAPAQPVDPDDALGSWPPRVPDPLG